MVAPIDVILVINNEVMCVDWNYDRGKCPDIVYMKRIFRLSACPRQGEYVDLCGSRMVVETVNHLVADDRIEVYCGVDDIGHFCAIFKSCTDWIFEVPKHEALMKEMMAENDVLLSQ